MKKKTRKMKITKKKIPPTKKLKSLKRSEKSFKSISSTVSSCQNLLSMNEFKDGLVKEDILNQKKMILPFIKYLENKEIFSHYFDEDFNSSDSVVKGKMKVSHGEIFHFLFLTNKFMGKETKY